jgi:hypothetical protein
MGPGLAGVGIARQPDGIIPHVGHDFRQRFGRRSKGPTDGVPTPATPPAPTDPAPTEAPVRQPSS